jgi:hypothetical protein
MVLSLIPVGIIVPISGTLDIETNRDYKTFVEQIKLPIRKLF